MAEIAAELSDVAGDVVPIKGLEAKLPYTMACIHENFRINPVFSMPLPREVTAREGHDIDGNHIPAGVRYSLLPPATYYDELTL